ncbi:MotA/TolQ/ExbB proton channel family protein [Novosphingobium sp. MMS21-SN21R]|uniref:MotA/TolQ/ExbB proton channel family protein n=1 Tax=Novosphingobium sp. MMS21-SN21R TaxID=2969298 RepID=UPI002885AC82|nr:MotA/TolQ/ExbB proton channel family protein [Novosphingobium sp. MMS21-SN21R]MDT0506866.1 MotA/TolQ/ExbB proton channel family protein [Novosphingobium sp. MMS21-SN21R]
MQFSPLIDGLSATIVVGGTALATVLRAGPRELAFTARALAGLFRPQFTAELAKADLAGQVSAIRREGVLRVNPKSTGDRAFDEATDLMIRSRSLDPLIERHNTYRRQRMAEGNSAVRTLAQAAELGPVFGMVGTLVSLSSLPANGLDAGALNGAISMAVVTTLYGLLLANLLLAPLARLIERHAQAEELARAEVIDWLTVQLEAEMPPRVQPLRPQAVPRERHHA